MRPWVGVFFSSLTYVPILHPSFRRVGGLLGEGMSHVPQEQQPVASNEPFTTTGTSVRNLEQGQ